MRFLDWDHTPMLLSDDGMTAWAVFNPGEPWSDVDPIEAAYAYLLSSEAALRSHFAQLYGPLPPLPSEAPTPAHALGALFRASE